MSKTWRRNGLALATSVSLHGVTALALLTPWSAPPEENLPPMIIELIPASAPQSPRQAAATVPAVSAAHTPAMPSPATRQARVSPHPISRPSAMPRQMAESVAPSAEGAGNPAPTQTEAGSETGGSGGESGGGNTSAPPGYSLGTALTPVPDYPWSARRRGIEGRVVIRLEVGADGRPVSVDLVHSSGDDALDQAAIDTLHHWRLRPATADGLPVPGRVVVPILFKLT